MKWIGAALLLLTTTCIGFEYSLNLKRRPQHIIQMKNALQILEAEIIYSQTPLKEAFIHIANQIPHPTKQFFWSMAHGFEIKDQSFQAIWEDNIEWYIKTAHLKKTEQHILNQLGSTIGQYDFTNEQKHIQLTLTHLERVLQDARDNYKTYAKTSKSLGVLSGVFIIIILF